MRENEAELWTASALSPLRSDSVVSAGSDCGSGSCFLFNLRIFRCGPLGLFDSSGFRGRRLGLRTALRRILSPPSVVTDMDMVARCEGVDGRWVDVDEIILVLMMMVG